MGADRYTYLGQSEIFLAVAWLVPQVIKFAKILMALSLSFVAFLFVVSSIQLVYGSDSISLFTRNLKVAGENYKGHYNLGLALKDKGDFDLAEVNLKRAVYFAPHKAEAYNSLGLIYSRRKEHGKALYWYLQAYERDPKDPGILNNVGVSFYYLGKYKEAGEFLKKALVIEPNYANAHYYLGLALKRMGEMVEGERHIQEAQRINPVFKKLPLAAQ